MLHGFNGFTVQATNDCSRCVGRREKHKPIRDIKTRINRIQRGHVGQQRRTGLGGHRNAAYFLAAQRRRRAVHTRKRHFSFATQQRSERGCGALVRDMRHRGLGDLLKHHPRQVAGGAGAVRTKVKSAPRGLGQCDHILGTRHRHGWMHRQQRRCGADLR